MLRRSLVSRVSLILGLQPEGISPLVANDNIVSSPVDEYGRPPKSQEMINKYGHMAKYANPNLTKVDTSNEVVLNTYPDGPSLGRLENYNGKLDETWSASFYDEAFFRKNILLKKPAQKHEDRADVLDFVLTSSLCGLTAYILRSTLIYIWYIGTPRQQLLTISNVEVTLSEFVEKVPKLVVWRGAPVFIYPRTEFQVKAMEETPLSALKDPQTDQERVPTRRNLLVCKGVCTHLGCLPIANEGAYAGFFCPCHGSHYDISGRIRQGPAPLNLEVPPYEWLNEQTIYLGN